MKGHRVCSLSQCGWKQEPKWSLKFAEIWRRKWSLKFAGDLKEMRP
jgi:hypothetical protein